VKTDEHQPVIAKAAEATWREDATTLFELEW